MAELPAPQRHALDVALLRAEPQGEGPLQRAIGMGLLGLLRTLAEAAPTLVAIDDTHWLDAASESALAFVARRLNDERIGLLCVRRGGGPDVPLGLDRALAHGHFDRLALGGLSADALDLLLRTNLATPPSRRTIARIGRATGGNLYFALEIGRALDARGERLEASDELPIPDSLQELVRDRLAQLPPPARAAAQAAAALSRPTVAAVDAALAPGSAAEAVSAGVLERAGERLEFVHPLLATVAYQLLSEGERRELHARLAEILREPEERAQHLALATPEADETVAAALEVASRRAAARGAPGTAADLLRQAVRLTPAGADDERRRRGIEAAERSFEAGEVAHARTLLGEIVAESPHGARRAEALARLGWVCAHAEGFHAGADVFFAALAEPADDPRLRIEILTGLAWCLHSTRTVPSAADRARCAQAGRGARRPDRARERAGAQRVPRLARRRRPGLRHDRARAGAGAFASLVAGRRPPRLDPRSHAGVVGLARRSPRAVRSPVPRGARPRRRALAPVRALPARAQRAADGRLAGGATPRARVPRDDDAQRAGRRPATLRARNRGARRSASRAR